MVFMGAFIETQSAADSVPQLNVHTVHSDITHIQTTRFVIWF